MLFLRLVGVGPEALLAALRVIAGDLMSPRKDIDWGANVCENDSKNTALLLLDNVTGNRAHLDRLAKTPHGSMLRGRHQVDEGRNFGQRSHALVTGFLKNKQKTQLSFNKLNNPH